MSTKKEKCCEVCESPNGCITAFIGQNCPCHQSESIEWEEIARDTAEHIGIISQGCLETLCEEVAEKAYKEGLSENIEELERASEKYKTLFWCIHETEREKVKAAFKETRDAFHEDELHCGCLAMCEWILDGKPEANINLFYTRKRQCRHGKNM